MFWRDVHAVTGFWVSFFALFLLISGLPWARSWGGLLKDVRHLSSTTVARQDWTTGRSSELEQRRLASTPTDEHAGHHHGGSTSSSGEMAAPRDYRALDTLLPVVQAANLEPPVLIAPPSRANSTWSAKSDIQNRPHRAELTLDGDRGVIIARHDFGQLPLLDRIIGIGIATHEGQLFAPDKPITRTVYRNEPLDCVPQRHRHVVAAPADRGARGALANRAAVLDRCCGHLHRSVRSYPTLIWGDIADCLASGADGAAPLARGAQLPGADASAALAANFNVGPKSRA